MNKKTLEQLYIEHGGKVSDKWSLYLAEYGRVFEEFRERPVSLLEIGIQNGGSLEIWSQYFPNARRLVGCDVNPDCARLSFEEPRIALVIGDANSDATEESILKQASAFDLIIDDGSHRSGDIVRSFARYFPHLADGGVFVAEDLHCSYWQEYEGGLFDPFSSISFFKRLADTVNYEHWGIDGARTNILVGFFSKYNFQIEEETLRHVRSVEFVNSMCVIRKSMRVSNDLGPRRIAGVAGLVGPKRLLGLQSDLCRPLDQSENEWTVQTLPLEERLVVLARKLAERDAKIAILDRAIAERDGQIAAFYRSMSWRIAGPLRAIGHLIAKVRRFARRAWSVVQYRGGLKAILVKAAQLYRHEGLKGLKQAGSLSVASILYRNNYAKWIRRYDTLTNASRAAIRTRIEGMTFKPRISVVMPTYDPKPEWLIEAIESVRKQIYTHWELCIADDASTNAEIRPILERYARDDPRIKLAFRNQNGHIAAASNTSLELATGEWTVLLDHDDLLAEHALFWVADAIGLNPNTRLIYSDEDKIDFKGMRFGPYFKCDWNVDLFYSQNMFSHLGAYQTALLRKVGGFRQGTEGSQDYDLALRCIERIEPEQVHHIPRVLYHWRAHATSTAQSVDSKPYAVRAGEKALNEHFQRLSVNARAESIGHGYRVRYALPSVLPLVSLIIPTRNGLDLIRPCVESILEKTTYPNYEILIVDNGSDDSKTLAYLEGLESNPQVRVVRDDRPFNYSALNNAAAKLARGEVVGLISKGIKVVAPDWLSEMVAHALRPEVGAVGARLWSLDDTLQHGGIVLGIGGIAGHAHRGLPRDHNGYFGRANLIQSLSAVTAACLMIRKAVYEEVGGLNETELQVAFNDVDFCLKVRAAGYRNIWTPYAELYHHESATRGYHDTPEKQARFAKESQYMKQRWGDLLLADPAYSPNLTLDQEDFSLAWPPRVRTIAGSVRNLSQI